MKANTKETISDLNLLIDISCMGSANLHLFEQFHITLIRIAYKSTDISVDYLRKRVYMHVKAEDNNGDFLIKYDQCVPTIMAINLVYEDFSEFLKECVMKDSKRFRQYYPSLISRFFTGRPATKNLHTLKGA